MIILSPILTVFELTVVVVPLTVKSPETITLPLVVNDEVVILLVSKIPLIVVSLNVAVPVNVGLFVVANPIVYIFNF